MRNKIKDFPSPSASGKFNASAILRPPRRPPQVMIKAVLGSNFLRIDNMLIGTVTPTQREKTTQITTKKERTKKLLCTSLNSGMISIPIKINKMAFRVTSTRPIPFHITGNPRWICRLIRRFTGNGRFWSMTPLDKDYP